MLRMEQIEAIKRMSRSESISTIASALNIDWKTAKKYAEMDDFNVAVETKVARARASNRAWDGLTAIVRRSLEARRSSRSSIMSPSASVHSTRLMRNSLSTRPRPMAWRP